MEFPSDTHATPLFDELEIGHIITVIEPFNSFLDLNAVRERLDEFPEVNSLPVEKNGGVIGLVKKSTVLEKTKSAIGSMLTKDLDAYVEKHPFIVDSHENVEKVLALILRESRIDRDEDILVYYRGRYFGVVSFKTLLIRVNEIREQDMNKAKEIQEFRINKSNNSDPHISSAHFIQMAHSIGGDFIQIAELNEHLTVFGAFDVSGKNVTAALTTSVIGSFFSLLRQKAEQSLDMGPTDVCQRLNELLCDQTPLQVFVVAALLFVDKRENQLILYNYGFNPVYLFTKNGKYTRVNSQFPPLGLDTGLDENEDPARIPLTPGLKIFSYSDGLTDVKNQDAVMYGEEETHQLIIQNSTLPAEEMVTEISRRINKYRGKAPQSDDISMLCVEIAQDYR